MAIEIVAPKRHVDNEQVSAHLKAIGYKDGDFVFLRLFSKNKLEKGINRSEMLPDFDTAALEQYQSEGKSVYFIVNGGGHKDDDVKCGRAFFFEHDQLSKAESLVLWQSLGLPEPTIQVDTGGKSIHSYWVLEQPCTIEAWRSLQVDLLEFADADRKLKNPSRVMRLAGCWHPDGEQSRIVTNTGKRYQYDQLRRAIPGRQQTTTTEMRWHEFEANCTLPLIEAVPIEICLSRENRDLIAHGIGEGGRNDRGFALAANLIGTAEYLASMGQRLDSDPRNLFESYCDRCSPAMDAAERDAVWKSASQKIRTTSLPPDAIEGCLKGYAWREYKQSAVSGQSLEVSNQQSVEQGSKEPEKKKAKEEMNAAEVAAELERIFNLEDGYTQLWDLGTLAKKTGRTAAHLVSLYERLKDSQYTFSPMCVVDFVNAKPAEREWLVAGHIPVGTTVGLIADGGTGKTILAYDLAKAIATGTPWNGFKTKKSKVLIIQTDEPENDSREKLDINGFAEVAAADQAFIQQRWRTTQIKQLRSWIEQHIPQGETGFVIIDSHTSANRSTETKEQDTAHCLYIYDLRDLANEMGVTFFVLHHTNKNGGSRGSTAFEDNVSEVWFLSNPDAQANLRSTQKRLEIRKSRSGCSGIFQIELDVLTNQWEHQGNFGADENTPLSLSEKIQNYLKLNLGKYYSLEDIMMASSFANHGRDAVKKQLERLRQKGLIEGEWREGQKGKKAQQFRVYTISGDGGTPNDSDEGVPLKNKNDFFSAQSVPPSDQNDSNLDTEGIRWRDTLENMAGQMAGHDQDCPAIQNQDLVDGGTENANVPPCPAIVPPSENTVKVIPDNGLTPLEAMAEQNFSTNSSETEDIPPPPPPRKGSKSKPDHPSSNNYGF